MKMFMRVNFYISIVRGEKRKEEKQSQKVSFYFILNETQPSVPRNQASLTKQALRISVRHIIDIPALFKAHDLLKNLSSCFASWLVSLFRDPLPGSRLVSALYYSTMLHPYVLQYQVATRCTTYSGVHDI